jgi:lipopolysaccharide biosynthesis regulator YciM
MNNKQTRQAIEELERVAEQMGAFLQTELGKYIVKSLDTLIEAHTQRGDNLSETAALRCYDAARGARDAKEVLTYPINAKEGGLIEQMKRANATGSQ